MPNAVAWARLFAAARPFVEPMPRAGAWYPVVDEADLKRRKGADADRPHRLKYKKLTR